MNTNRCKLRLTNLTLQLPLHVNPNLRESWLDINIRRWDEKHPICNNWWGRGGQLLKNLKSQISQEKTSLELLTYYHIGYLRTSYSFFGGRGDSESFNEARRRFSIFKEYYVCPCIFFKGGVVLLYILHSKHWTWNVVRGQKLRDFFHILVRE